jgi:cell division protease FtsH
MRQKESPEERQKERPSDKKTGFWVSLFWWVVFIVAFAWLWQRYTLPAGEVAQIDYTTFRQQVQSNNVAHITMTGEKLEGQFRGPSEVVAAGDEEPATYTDFVTYLPSSITDETLFPLLEEHEVVIEAEPPVQFPLGQIILAILPFLLFLALGYALLSRIRQQERTFFSLGESRAKLYKQQPERTTFDDVAGLGGAKTELQEIVEYLRNPQRVQRLGGKVPKGVLLVGPPGTGKTLLARAVAGEADVPFFSITGSDFMEVFVGVGASRVRALFADARQAAPSIIFVDELDSIGRLRGAGLGGGHDEREQTLNQLLSELDGFRPNENVIVMAATNRPDILDPALLRPGRFDRHITVDLPALSARQQILAIHARNKPLARDVDLARLARGTPGFSGADLENVLNEAALLAARQNKEAIEWSDIEDARDKVLLGLVREGLAPTEEECRLIAYHEAGHAILAAVLPHADPIHKVTIIPRGQTMGVTQQLPEREKLIYTREYMLDRLAVMMGGRAAENIVFGTATSGAENDLKQATLLARQMVLDWGMSERLEHVALGGRHQHVFLGQEIAQRRDYSETTAREVDEEIKAILDAAYEQAADTLNEYRQELDIVACALLEHEEVTGEEALALINPERATILPLTWWSKAPWQHPLLL